jgi:dihydrolipoamide dehydrogenase
VIIATGSAATMPNIPGLREADPWTSDDATSITAIPGSIAILGGGVVACEAATWLAGLGADVTLLEREDRLLSRFEPRASDFVLKGLVEAGVDVRCGATTTSVSRGQEVELNLGVDGKLWVDEILVATGRSPRREGLGLEEMGLRPPTWQTDASMRLGSADGWLYAVGDVNASTAMLTHVGKYQARIAGEDIARRFGTRHLGDRWEPGRPPREPVVPQVVFTDPEVASVGLTMAAARQRGHELTWVEYEVDKVAGASLLAPNFRGWACLVIESGSRRLLGATFVGLRAGEMLHAATLAVTSGIDVRHLWDVIPSYPTISEVWLRLLETLRDRELRVTQL